jgi:RNA polymerase sigma-70 factor (ECF subfamily)
MSEEKAEERLDPKPGGAPEEGGPVKDEAGGVIQDSSEVERVTMLVHKAVAGSLEAFEELVTKYQRAVFNIALYKSKNYFDAEDLTQDIFLAAFKALSSLKEAEHFPGWLFGIAYNRCHKWYQRERNKIVKIQEIKERVAREERSRNRAPTQPQLSGQGNGAGSSHQPVSELLQRLPAEVKEALTLKYLEGLSYQEIEGRLGINSHRIDYLIRKGKQMLRERMEPRSEGGCR